MPSVHRSRALEVPVRLGLRENARPFAWLVLINAFVGAMVGLERSLFPDFARNEFGVETAAAVLSFIAVFGLFKAVANYFAGRWAQRLGRKALLMAGWVLMIPVPLLLFWAPSWTVVVAANALLGAGQGLAWSSTVVMKIDLVGPKHRGWAMGINEFAGYVAVGVVALLSTYAAEGWGIRGVLLSGEVLAVFGLLASWLRVPDTRAYAALEAAQTDARPTSTATSLFWDTTWRNPRLRALTQAGWVNNLNDGAVWGLFPLFLAQADAPPQSVGWIVGIYPTVWGLGQLLTGRWGDRMPKRRLLFWGMALQGVVLLVFPVLSGPWAWAPPQPPWAGARPWCTPPSSALCRTKYIRKTGPRAWAFFDCGGIWDTWWGPWAAVGWPTSWGCLWPLGPWGRLPWGRPGPLRVQMRTTKDRVVPTVNPAFLRISVLIGRR